MQIKAKNCDYCNISFEYQSWPNSSSNEKYCSVPCSLKGRSLKVSFWPLATEDQKKERMKSYFDSKIIEQKDDCWGWSGRLKSGYGIIPRGRQEIKAHRFIWEYFNGPIPEKMFVCHTCDNRSCNKISHLFIGTHKDNMNDMISKNRQKGAVGERNRSAILSSDNVKDIKNLICNNVAYEDICKKYTIKKNVLYSIKNGVSWKHVK